MSENKQTKLELVETIYENLYDDLKIDRQTIHKVIDSLLLSIKDSLARGETIELRGFGTFEPRLRNGREKARNPRTGEQVTYTPRYVAVFRPGQELKKKMKEIKLSDEKESGKEPEK